MARPTFNEVMARKERLLPDLAEYLVSMPAGVLGSEEKWLKHPLVFAIPFHEELSAVYNEQFRARATRLAECKEAGNWSRYIWMHERPYRFWAFDQVKHHLSDADYWEELSALWIDSENLHQVQNLPELLEDRPGRERMMDDRERALFDTLPESFVIFRGHQGINRMGFSWSLSYWQARWFAERYAAGRRPGVVRAEVPKSHILAVQLGRGEFEIVVNPGILPSVQTVRSLPRPAHLESVLEIACARFSLHQQRSIHGPWHWDKVERNAIELCRRTPKADKLVCRHFAILHDCCREDDHTDPLHGIRAAEFVVEIQEQLKLNEVQLKTLAEACRYHNDGQVSDDPTIGVCWDADRLDLSRVGIAPDPLLMSTEAGKELIWRV